jgi:hypothetical protein
MTTEFRGKIPVWLASIGIFLILVSVIAQLCILQIANIQIGGSAMVTLPLLWLAIALLAAAPGAIFSFAFAIFALTRFLEQRRNPWPLVIYATVAALPIILYCFNEYWYAHWYAGHLEAERAAYRLQQNIDWCNRRLDGDSRKRARLACLARNQQPEPKGTWIARTYPSLHYVIQGGEAYDKLTKLTWARCSVGQTWQDSKGCVGQVAVNDWDDVQRLHGDTWRVPTLEELRTLLVPRSQDYFELDTYTFPGMDRANSTYCTSTTSQLTSREGAKSVINYFRTLQFYDGVESLGNPGHSPCAIRLVRGPAGAPDAFGKPQEAGTAAPRSEVCFNNDPVKGVVAYRCPGDL